MNGGNVRYLFLLETFILFEEAIEIKNNRLSNHGVQTDNAGVKSTSSKLGYSNFLLEFFLLTELFSYSLHHYQHGWNQILNSE